MKYLRNLILTILVLSFFAIVPAAYAAMAVMWDQYTDPNATGLRIESSTDQSDWSIEKDNIDTGDTGASITAGADNTRVYYRMKAFNATDVSDPSNVVSFFWTTGGDGSVGLQTPGVAGFVDCTASGLTSAETQACQDADLLQ